MRVLLPDSWHFHRRNFAALFDAFRRADATVLVERSRRAWWKRHGDYRALEVALAPHLAAVDAARPEDWGGLEHEGVNLFEVARAEFLCLVLPRPHWRGGCGPNQPAAILARALERPEDRADLRLCLAAARDWLGFWAGHLRADPAITHVFAFSGSYVYTRALLALAGLRGIRSFVMESFFTGHEFYLEERTTPLANNSRLGHPDWMARLGLPGEGDDLDRLRAHAQARLAGMRNKNVRAPDVPLAPLFPPGRRTVLIVGQVLNDFSLIETPLAELSSVATYRDLIAGVLSETPHNVVFKAHPWERKRPNIRAPMTLQDLQAFAAELPEAQRARLALVEEPSIRQLFHQADWVVGLCSQGLLEACQAGLKPAQIGRAFFGGQGFTHDFDGAAPFLAALRHDRVAPRLSIADYRRFEDFLVRALLVDLVRNDAAGVERVLARLSEPAHVPSAPNPESTSNAGSPQVGPGLLLDLAYYSGAWIADGFGWLVGRTTLRRQSSARAEPPAS